MEKECYVLEVCGTPGCPVNELASFMALALESEGYGVEYTGFPVGPRKPGKFLSEGKRFWGKKLGNYDKKEVEAEYCIIAQGPYYYGIYAHAFERSGLVPPGEGSRAWVSLASRGVPERVDGMVLLTNYTDEIQRAVRKDCYPSWHWDEFFVNRLLDSMIEVSRAFESSGRDHAHIPSDIGVLESNIRNLNRAWEIVLEEKERRVPYVSEEPLWPVTESGTLRY